jgi:hypothetical protein
MREHKGFTGWIMATLLLAGFIGCGQETAFVADTVRPVVTATTPAAGATAVGLNTALTATFSKPMNAASLNASTFTLRGPGGNAVLGAVSASGSVATFVPATPLAAATSYVATITTGATDTASPANSLLANYVWTFTTVPFPTPPTVTSTVPANGAASVPVAQVLSATFSAAMNAATINTTTFKLSGPGGVAVAGAVNYTTAGSVATFTPSTSLAFSTTYVATITTGAQDTNGTALASNYVWTFTTVAAPIPPAAPVVIATVPLNGATGVLLTQAISATFSTAMNAATLTTTTFTLTGPSGTVVPGVVTYNTGTNTATFTPTGSLLVSSTYVATITTGAQSTAGLGLVSNYVWTFRTVPAPTPPTVIVTNPANKAAGVPVNQQIAATFSSAMNPATINSTTYTLTAPGNVAVAGTVTYVASGSVATFAPTVALAASTTYVATITTGAQDLTGTALAANYVWTFTTAAAPNTTRPTVIASNPVNNATGVPFNQAVTVTFSEAMNPATINTTTFTLAGPGVTAVTGTVTYAAVGNTATFTPLTNLLASTVYTATVTTGSTDLYGNTLLTNYVWTFTTGAIANLTKPLVTLTNPVSGATGVALTQAISATFSEAMNPLTLTTATFTVTTGGVAIAGTITYNPVTFIATFTPSVSLTASTIYVATVTTGAQDLAGNALGAGSIPNPWSFTTGATVVVPPVNLGTASLFGGFGGGAGMTNMGTATVVNGNIGTTGVSTLITGFHDNGVGCTYTETPLNIGYVNGTIDTAAPPPTVGCPTEGTAITGAIATQAAADTLTAYNALVAFPGGLDVSVCAGCGGGSAGELGNRTLAPGIYKSAPGSYTISQGNLTLDAQGNPNAFWVFQMATTLTDGTPATSRSVLLINGAQAKNVFWQVGTAATISGIVGGGTFSGTVISQSGIAVSTAGVAAVTTVNGRLLVTTGPVTLVNTVVNTPAP